MVLQIWFILAIILIIGNLHIFTSISWSCLLFSSLLLLHSRQKAPKILRQAPVMSAQHDSHTGDDNKLVL
jgi:hypothetical protein